LFSIPAPFALSLLSISSLESFSSISSSISSSLPSLSLPGPLFFPISSRAFSLPLLLTSIALSIASFACSGTL